MDAYCFRCKTKKEMKDATESRMRNGKVCMTGTCVTCGTRLFKIMPTHPRPEPAKDPVQTSQ
ncbi:MAG: hypothetical protein OHK0029_33320 [Armatimonadaceae bacterium]